MIRSFLYIVILIIPKWAFSAIRFSCIVAIFGVVECRDQIRKVRGTDEKFVRRIPSLLKNFKLQKQHLKYF